MSFYRLNLQKNNAMAFEEFTQRSHVYENLFVVTHLGQLKQMEALIHQKGIKNNLLMVLYTTKNLDVPSSVGNQVCEEIFDNVVFLEIPFGIQRFSYKKMTKVLKKYETLIQQIKIKSLYVNSFEGHYAILLSMASSYGIKTNLVEEGTAIYKNLGSQKLFDINQYKKINYAYVKQHFMQTVGTTQVFKKIVKHKKSKKSMRFLLRDTGLRPNDFMDKKSISEYKKFFLNIDKDLKIQEQATNIFGKKYLKKSLKPFIQFDKVYASHPDLLKTTFTHSVFERFFLYNIFNIKDIDNAKYILNKYHIRAGDILYVHQRYSVDFRLYALEIQALLRKLAIKDVRIFIKLHPKDDRETVDLFLLLEKGLMVNSS